MIIVKINVTQEDFFYIRNLPEKVFRASKRIKLW